MSAGAVQKLVQGSAVASSAPSALFGHEGCGAMAAGDSIRQRISSWPMSLSSVSSLGSQGRCAYPGGLPSMPELEEPVYHSMTSPEAACTVSHAFAPQPPGGPLPRPASMPALGGKPLKFDPGVQPEAVPRRKGRGGRTAAMDPRLDPNIDPKRAKRILANRLSAARSKNKQRGHLDTLEKSRATLTSQKESLVKEIAWLQSEVRSLEEDGAELQAKLRNLQERALLQEALQIKLLQECGHPALGHGSDYGGATLPMQPY
uniref:BZIP domain-containing protein n=2 Tax=Tetraselmis sp. GSL018 TaxID=582737 RepID=A0A061S1E8_9CHLO